MSGPIVIERPLVLMFEQNGALVTHLYPRASDTHESYGLMVADLIRHVAIHFNVEPEDAHELVKKELAHPTTDITRPS